VRRRIKDLDVIARAIVFDGLLIDPSEYSLEERVIIADYVESLRGGAK